MSGPFRFNNEPARSPLDRQAPNLFPAGQPPSFKTNVNRMKTKKWVEAKKNAYDGDDWGDYDEYDEYGVDQGPPAPASPYAQRVEQPSRSFTDPQRQGPPPLARRNSFETGDEHRSFSASMSHPHPSYRQQPYVPPIQTNPAQRQMSMAESDTSDTPQHRRDFSPSAMPPPLHTRMSPAPASGTGSPANTQFPPRKSSIGQVDSPSAVSSRERAPSNSGKALPFIRPADIYKRVDEERQRASLDSSRPSLDSLSSRPRDDVTSAQGVQERVGPDNMAKSPETGRSLQPMETVAERKSEYLPDFNVDQSHQQGSADAPALQQHSLPPVQGVSSFGNDFWSTGSQPEGSASHTPAVSPPDDQGFRSVVDQAFTRADDSRSVPPTPTSKQSDSDVSRSNTTSTSGISPIMSRVPSSATSALKNRNQAGGDGSTPAIAEEPSETGTPVSRPTSSSKLGGPHQVPRKPSPSHSRDTSNPSLPRSGLSTPSRGESPARSPAISPQTKAPEPEEAQLATLSSASSDAMEGGLGGRSAAYATREAESASGMRMSPDKVGPGLGAAQRQSQDAFLESHAGQFPIGDAMPRSRSESPNKGRVQELAGKFGEVSHSRRGSTQSNNSRNSVQSWEKSQDNTRPSSPKKADASPTHGERPAAGREASFRPKLPGQWESYATTAGTPNEQVEKEKDLDYGNGQVAEGHRKVSSLEEVDFTPTTAKHPVSANVHDDDTSDPLSALKAAGAAMGDALQASVGIGTHSEPPRNPESSLDANSHGDLYSTRPLQFDRTTSAVSTIPPTPPAKDTPESEEVPPPPPLKERSPDSRSSSNHHTPERPIIIPQLSTDATAEDQESDRLRKEIVASLSPLRTSVSAASEPNRASLQPGGQPGTNRESSLLPSEYDSYWADGERVTPRPSHDLRRDTAGHSPEATKSSAASEPHPSLLTRFSWENDAKNSPSTSSDGPAQTGAVTQKASTPEAPKVPPQSGEYFPDYFGTAHTNAVEGLAPNDKSVLPDRSTPPLESIESLNSPTPSEPMRVGSPTSGLHVVNSALNPEAIDIPPRLSAEMSPPSQAQGNQEAHQEAQTTSEQKIAEEDLMIKSPVSAPGTPSANQEPTVKSPDSSKPLGFQEIATLKSPAERIATYNKTREYWAKADHGLGDWLASAMAANPELATQSFHSARPQMASSPSRHKATGSLSLFGKHHGASNSQTQTTPYYEQYNSAASQVPNTPTSAGPASHGGGSGRISSHQMQARGKDFLHTAGVLGGKGMTGAKGLFAKGKSRFKSDKAPQRPDSMPSSREVSEEPEPVSVTPRTPTDASEAGREEKKRRRFSSPFHRSSRSRSRPTSIALPGSTFLDLGTPRATPPRETPPAEGSRPQSFHAPDAWNVLSASQSQACYHATNESTPAERLGVLPSPAKSAFSLFAPDRESNVPPVPPIPDAVQEAERGRRRSQENASHGMLQSVMRHSTPPAMEASQLQHSPVFDGPAAASQAGQADDEKTGDWEGAGKGGFEGGALAAVGEDAAVRTGPQEEGSEHDAVEREASQPKHLPAEAAVTPAGPSQEHWQRVDGQEDDDDDKPPQVVQDMRMQKPSQPRGDGSPMLPPVHVTSRGAGKGTQTSPPAYETELVGAGDISPISSRAEDGAEGAQGAAEPEAATAAAVKREPASATALRQARPVAAAVDEAGAPAGEAGEAAGAPSRGGDGPSPPAAGLGRLSAPPPPRAATPQRLSASPYRVVHAVEYVPSQSSFETWDQDSVAAPSHSEGSQVGDRPEDHVPPVPQLPMPRDNQAGDATEPPDRPANFAAPAAVLQSSHPPASDVALPDRHVSPVSEAAKPGHHKRSQSLLSAISSMVSDDGDAAMSPVPSRAGRRKPSASRQMQVVSGKAVPVATRITEESAPEKPNNTSAASDDDFDLYADHDGVVKDVRNERGEPLRVAASQRQPPVPPQPTADAKSASRGPPMARQEDATRYSDERPMSFVSGPRDAHGRPQDQINRPPTATTAEDAPPVPQIPPQLKKHAPTIPSSAPIQPSHQQQQHIGHVERDQISPLPTSHNQQHSSTPSHSTVSPAPPGNASPPPQPAPPPVLLHRPLLNEPQSQNGPFRDPAMPDPAVTPNQRFAVDPRLRGVAPGQAMSADPRTQGHPVRHDPRMLGQSIGAPTGPRNQYEMQQQMMQRQTQLPIMTSLQPAIRSASTPEEKFSRPKISSMLKGLGGKISSYQTSSQSSSQRNATLPLSHEDTNRSASYQSSLSGLPTDHFLAKKDRRASALSASANRPPSVGTESRFSQVSGDSTRVNAADSRLDLRHPSNPASFRGIPPQQTPSGPPVPPPKQFQTERASKSGVPESGKKKRFSALGILFSRNGTPSDSLPKLTKEEKKAQKAQKRTTAPPIEAPSSHPWPVSQHRIGPQQFNTHRGPPPVVERQISGMQGYTHMTMSPQNIPPQNMPPHHGSFGFPQQAVQPSPASQPQPPMPPRQPSNSAYLNTRQIAQAHQAQRQQALHQTSQPMAQDGRPIMHGASFSFDQNAQDQISLSPPLDGYYPPDIKQRPQSTEHHPAFQPIGQRHAEPSLPISFAGPGESLGLQQIQPHSNSRGVSSSMSNTGAQMTSQNYVPSQMNEPRYETPQIPAAYNHVSGEYIAAEDERRHHASRQGQRQRQAAMHPNNSNRQPSGQQLQPLSPQTSGQISSLGQRSQSDSSTASVVSPLSDPSPGLSTDVPISNQTHLKPRMSSITEAVNLERPWNLNVRDGATDQEIVRARQKQIMEQQLATQEQLHAERSGHSPSPGVLNHTTLPSPRTPQSNRAQGEGSSQKGESGFREVLPRSSPQPYPMSQALHQSPRADLPTRERRSLSPSHNLQPVQPTPKHWDHPSHPAAYPLPMSPDPANISSPINPAANDLPLPPPPKFSDFQVSHSPPPQAPQQFQGQVHDYGQPTTDHQPDYEQQPPDEPPPSYSGPGVPNEGMYKEDLQERPSGRPRPPNIMTDAEIRGRLQEPRSRQISVGVLEHPQPASMAASPQRSETGMGASSLRRQLFEQEERDRQDRIRRAEAQRVESERERQERERNRARARELERSVSGGGRVGSLQSVSGSGRGSGPGWERSGSSTRPVFELPAEEDEEPVMRATSFPGQEWTPYWEE